MHGNQAAAWARPTQAGTLAIIDYHQGDKWGMPGGEAFGVLASLRERCAAKWRAMQKLPQTVDQQWGKSAVVWHAEAGIIRLPDARALLKSILRLIKSCAAIFQNRTKCTKRRSWCRLSQRSNVWFLSESIWRFLKGSCDRLYFPSGLVGMMGWDWGQWVDGRYIINNAFRRFLFDVAFSIWVKRKKKIKVVVAQRQRSWKNI